MSVSILPLPTSSLLTLTETDATVDKDSCKETMSMDRPLLGTRDMKMPKNFVSAQTVEFKGLLRHVAGGIRSAKGYTRFDVVDQNMALSPSLKSLLSEQVSR